ncbi:MAG: carbamoyltransferase HypF [Ignavibacteria bacterium]
MRERLKIIIRGAVQGVGFRPFVFRLASEMNLNGYVLNSSKGVFIEVEGENEKLKEFLIRIEKEKPQISIIQSLEYQILDAVGYNKFEIKKSEKDEETIALILPDIATCKDCLKELFDPNDRRYLYPFINCTNCGPRFTIIEMLPYDRPFTSMKNFKMCPDCEKEYHNPEDRRFHAQPVACPVCGPHIELWNSEGDILSIKENAIEQTIDLINKGKILAIKGLGGFHLVIDAANENAVINLRRRKHREEKPFALMFPDIQSVKQVCEVNELEERLLLSPESPIVLLRRKKFSEEIEISRLVAPDNPYLGIMLPYTPLHHILMKFLGKPIVATSGNLSEEPICIDEYEALRRLKGIADYFLVHNRPILRHCDDSIARIVNNREFIIRRARGFAPLPYLIENESDDSLIAVGGHLKNTIALKKRNQIFISQHIGDLSTLESFNAFKKTIDDFQKLYEVDKKKFVGDLHPEYLSTKFLKESQFEFKLVQHHLAHIAACKIENQVEGEALGVSWDGTGYGLDGKIWGSEFFIIDDESFEHIGQFRKFHLPSGEKAIKEPKRTLAGVLYEIYGRDILKSKILRSKFSDTELNYIINQIEKKINSPECVSAGRLFDAISSLTGISDYSNFEGQAAMKLEFVINNQTNDFYKFDFRKEEIFIIDWMKIIIGIESDLENQIDKGIIAAKFHNSLTEIIVEFAKKSGLKKVILSGGCFQNIYLLERTIKRLQEENFKVYWHQRIPTNDGGISVGQIAAFQLYNRKLKIS